MALLQFELDHSLPLPWSYMCSQGKFLYLPVNTALQLPENWLHFSSTTLMLSTESALLLAARYPIYTVSAPSPTLLSVCDFFSLRNITLSECICSCSRNQLYVLIRICQHIFRRSMAGQFARHPVEEALTKLLWSAGGGQVNESMSE